jgi:hypothetical protein
MRYVKWIRPVGGVRYVEWIRSVGGVRYVEIGLGLWVV